MGSPIGSLLSVSASTPASIDSTGFGALTYTQVGNIASIPPYGDTSQDVALPADLETGRVTHINGPLDGGEIGPITCHTEDMADAGQDIIRTGSNTNTTHSFKITKPSGDIDYFHGLIANYRPSAREGGGYEGCEFVVRANTVVVTVEA